MNDDHAYVRETELEGVVESSAAEIIQLERALSKLVRAAEFHLEGHDRSRENLQDAIATAKDYLS